MLTRGIMKVHAMSAGHPCYLCAQSAFAQTEDPPEVNARQGGNRAAAFPGGCGRGSAHATGTRRKRTLADAEDAALLRRTVYGNELTEDQADEMIAAAARRLERRKKAVDEARKLVDSGVASLLSVTPFLWKNRIRRARNSTWPNRARGWRANSRDMARAEEAGEAS